MDRSKLEEDGWRQFVALCLRAKSPQMLSELLTFFLTPEEKRDLALRYLLIEQLLEERSTQRQIAEKLQVSIARITRGSNALKAISPELRKFLNQ